MTKEDLEREYSAEIKMMVGVDKPFNPNNDNSYTRFLERKIINRKIDDLNSLKVDSSPKDGLKVLKFKPKEK